MPRAVRAKSERLVTNALLVRRVPYGEADWVATFFTEMRGLVATVARGARRSNKRFVALEPMHLLRVSLEDRAGAELVPLTEATLERPRNRLVADLSRLEAAGRALRWIRRASPPHTREPVLWQEVNELLDHLDDADSQALAEPMLAASGLRILSAVGWELDFSHCVRCGRECGDQATACIDARAGGLVCRMCGGASRVLRSDRRARYLAATLGQAAPGEFSVEDAQIAIELVEAALSAHSGQEEK